MTIDELEKLAIETGVSYGRLPPTMEVALRKFAELVTQEETLRCVTILLKMHDKAKSQHNYFLHAAGMLTRKDGE